MDDLRVLIVADDPLARAGLAALLVDQPGYSIVGQIATGTDLLTEVDIYRPDVVLWDLGWNPDLTSEYLADLKDTNLPVVALLPDETHVIEAWEAGIRGLLLRDVQEEKLLATLSGADQQLVMLDPALANSLFPTTYPAPDQPTEELTPRESEVLQLLAEGLPNKLIARQLDISEHTVKFHVNAILGKLGAQSRTEAVVRATRQGLILL